LSFNQGRGQIHVSLILSGDVGERIALCLEKDKAAIQQELGYQLTWELNNNGGEIYITDEGIPIRDQNDWPIQHDWFGDRLEDFQRVLQPRVLAFEKEALQDPVSRQALERRELQINYWRACASALLALNSRSAKTTRPRGGPSAASRPSTMASSSASVLSVRRQPHCLLGRDQFRLPESATSIQGDARNADTRTRILDRPEVAHQSPIPLGRHSR
jgi:hypothetical protein